MIIINTKTGKIEHSNFEAETLKPKSYEMPTIGKYDEPKKGKRGRKSSSKPKEKLTPVKELKAEVYATLNLAEGDYAEIKKLVGYAFFNTDNGKFESLVKRSTWQSIINALHGDNHGTLSADWVEFYNQQKGSKKTKTIGKATKKSTEKTVTKTGEPSLNMLKATVYGLLEVTDTESAKDKAKELGINIDDLSLRSKLGWENFRKRTVKKLNPQPEESPIVAVDSTTKSRVSQKTVEIENPSSLIENSLDTSETLEAQLASHWSRNRGKVYTELKCQKKTTSQSQSIMRMLQQCKKELSVQDFNDVLEVNGLTQFMFKAS